MSTQVGIIKQLVEGLTTTSKTGENAVNEALKSIGIKNYTLLVNNFKNDLYSGVPSYSSESARSSAVKTALEQYCGIRLSNTDTGAITGSDADGKSTKTAESVIPESTKAKTLSESEYNSFTKDGLTFNVTYDESSNYNSKYFDYDLDTYLEKQRLIVGKLYNWWVPESLALINESLGVNFYDGRASTNTINLKFTNIDNWSYADFIRISIDDDAGRASNITWTINMAYLNKITAADKNGTIDHDNFSGSIQINNTSISANWTNYFDRVVVQILAEMALKANISSYDDLPANVKLGLPRLVGGYDETMDDIIDDKYMSSNYTSSYGYAVMRYLVKQTADGKANDTIYIHNKDNTTGNSGNDTWIVTSKTKNATINTGGGKDTIQAFGGDGVVINGTSNADLITVTKSSIAGSGDVATIIGGKGNDTLIGSTGADVFAFGSSDGNNVITNYTTGTDSIKLTSGSVNKSTVNGKDVILTIGSTVVTVKSAKDKPITVTDSKGQTISQVYGEIEDTTSGGNSNNMTYNGSKTTVTLGNSFKGTLSTTDYVSSVKTIDASKVKSNAYIIGNTLANSIKGGSGADTLNGGKGNDTLTGGSGKDVFLFASGEGNDVITDYVTGQDSIRITKGSVGTATTSGNDVVLNIGSNKLTVKNASGKKMTVINSSGKSSTMLVGSSTTSTSDTMSYSSNKTILTLSSSFKGTLKTTDYVSSVKTIDASKVTNTTKIVGNSLANTIKGGTKADSINGGTGNDSILGNAGNDTLIGAKGNDTLTGGAGKDVFYYSTGDGNDVITDYTAGQDTIKLGKGSISKTSYSGNDVIFTVGSGKITVKNGKGKRITIEEANGDTSSKTYKSYEERWFLSDDSDVGDTALTSIIKNDTDAITTDYKFSDEADSIIANNLAILTSNKQKQ